MQTKETNESATTQGLVHEARKISTHYALTARLYLDCDSLGDNCLKLTDAPFCGDAMLFCSQDPVAKSSILLCF